MMLVPISEAKGRLSELVRTAEDEDVVLLRHGRPAGVLISTRRLEALFETIEDLEDRLAAHEASDMPEDMWIPWEKVKVELGLR
jgi:prevent-host-death family protein